VRKGDFIGLVAPREWDAIKASQQLVVTWSRVADPFSEPGAIVRLHPQSPPSPRRTSRKKAISKQPSPGPRKIVEAEYSGPFNPCSMDRAARSPMCGPMAP